LTLITAALAFAAVAPLAHAQGKLEAQYTATVAGITIGKGNWVIEITDQHYKAAASGVATGLVRIFTGGKGATAAQGLLSAGKPVSTIYASTITNRKKTDEVRLTFANGNVKDFKVDPPAGKDASRVPLTEAHKRGVMDPMTASLLRSPGPGNPVSRDACQHTLAIFDGRMRYDLQLAFKRMDHVKASKGYSGDVVVCAVYFAPVAGYIPSRSTIKYLSKQRDMEVWLAPIAGTHVLVPFRAQSPTPIGEAVLTATQFVATSMPTRASSNGTRTP
jgi:hypothetical protein